MKCIVAGCETDDAEGELNTGMCSPHYEIITGQGRAMLTGMSRHNPAARVIANLIPNELAFYDADALLPKQTRLLLAQPLGRFPFSGDSRVSSQTAAFRSDKPTLGNGTIAHYMKIIDSLGRVIQDYSERATKELERARQQDADIAAMRRLFDWRKIDAQG